MELPQLDLGQPPALAASFGLGTLLHIFIFRIGEWDNDASAIIGIFGGCYAASVSAALWLAHKTLGQPAFTVLDITAVYGMLVAGIFSSMLVYRAFFHPLRNFRGPFGSRLSNFYPTMLTLKKMQFFNELGKLHDQYGDFVRVGPNNLSIKNPKAVMALHSNASPCDKGPSYHLELPAVSVHSERDRGLHSQRRKPWDQALSSKALRDYEPRVMHYADRLLDHLIATEGKPINVSEQFNLYSFDVMGNLALGKDFRMLELQEMHPAIKLLHGTTKIAGTFIHMSWTLMLARWIPPAVKDVINFETWLQQMVDERVKNEPDVPDVFSWILAAYKTIPNPTPQQTLDLRGDAKLIVIAGSDSTAGSLTCLFMELASHPDIYRKLQAELDEYFKEHAVPEHVTLNKLPYLQACVNETLRMNPLVPSGLQRQTPPQGMEIDGTFIPGNTLVTVPPAPLHRDERMFEYPNEFIPERWTTKQHLVHNRAAFAPFSIGRYGCAGKQLALMEIRNVVARIAHRYDVSLTHKNAKAEFLDGLVDGFTMTCPKLDMVFTPRA